MKTGATGWRQQYLNEGFVSEFDEQKAASAK